MTDTTQKPMTGADYRALFEQDEKTAWENLKARIVSVKYDMSFDRQYPKAEREKRAEFVKVSNVGVLTKFHNAHGLCFVVRAAESYFEATFEPDELEDANLYSHWSCPGCKAEMFEVIAQLYVDPDMSSPHLRTLYTLQCGQCGFVTDSFTVDPCTSQLRKDVLGATLAPVPRLLNRSCENCKHFDRQVPGIVGDQDYCLHMATVLTSRKPCASWMPEDQVEAS